MKLNRHRPLLAMLMVAAMTLAACAGDPGFSPAADRIQRPGYPVASVFQPFLDEHGGLAVLGQAISPVLVEDGIEVQYLLNVRLEHHPDGPAGQRVILSPLGLEYGYREHGVPPPDDPAVRYDPVTQHTLYPEFEAFFDRLGGGEFLGHPIAEPRIEGNLAVQYFERGAIARQIDAPPGSGVRLAALGLAVYPVEGMQDSFRIELPRQVHQQPFAPFLEQIVRGNLLGRPLTEPYLTADRSIEQVYENGILISDPLAAGGTRLKPLGLAHRGAIDPPVPPLNDGKSLYFEATGHNVAHVFADYFQAHGGEAVFGLPISEHLLEDGLLVQYFENVRLEWRYGVPAALAPRLAPYGTEVSAVPPPASPEAGQRMILEAWPEFPVLAVGSTQTLYVLVLGENDKPVVGADVLLAVRPGNGGFTVRLAATDTAGRTQLSFTLDSPRVGEFVLYDVAATAPGRPPAMYTDAFIVWYGLSGP